VIVLRRFTLHVVGPDGVTRPTGALYWTRRRARREAARLDAPGYSYLVRRFWLVGQEFSQLDVSPTGEDT